ncbi:Npun_R2821/Npun_R2822 family protein [Argonema galeatum]|uniref:Npun_R2821/Npun_R2822 family protein n=1 Tax=Argonema galeatum TaxID=2942762 RepID=UPI0020114667|nr:Npun_R2821/Npun_R2822 family protein [Argonema galeatum]MCL1466746.1 methionine synthase [Argonema galeatum A003/A1]
MSRGIYIVANEKVGENAIALLNSIRYYDPNVSVFLIPFNDNYQNLAAILSEKHNVQIFPDLDFLNQFTQKIAEIFDRDFLALPNKMRKLVAWFGPLDEFLYIDTDIIVFEKIADVLDYLAEFGFICNDYHHAGRGLQDIFSPLIREQKIFTEEQLSDVFNSGFWASKKGTISLEEMYELLRECSQHREYFDFSRQVTDQPILNYIILKSIPKRLNLVKIPGGGPGSWAGSKHFQERDRVLYDGEKRLQYIHWAGTPMKPGAPYRELWEYYRYLKEPKPTETSTVQTKSFWQGMINKAKNLF